MNIQILTGKVKYISHEVNEKLTATPANQMDFVSKVDIEMRHNKIEGHEVDIIIEQGYVLSKTKNDVVLTIKSSSHFKIVPYDHEFFKKPASTLLVNTITDIVKVSSAHNSGMFCIIREDYGMDEISPQPIPKETIKNLIFNNLNRHLLS